jgi:tripartite-type tricarboxylate transporter receptor subunit TctC
VPFSLVTFFLGKQKKVTSCRAAPGEVDFAIGQSRGMSSLKRIATTWVPRGKAARESCAAAGTRTAEDDKPTYPTKPIRFIVPFPPGGGNDTIARTIGQKITEAWGTQVVIDNRAGAGGVIGAELAAKAAPDGYTLLLGGVATLAILPNLHSKLPYDPVRDFAPISLAAIAPLIVVVHPSVAARSIKELIALAKAKPGTLNFASNGKGGSSHLAAELFKLMAGVDMVHVPYKGLTPALIDLIAGQVQLMFSSTVAILPQVKTGKLRGLATTGAKRLSATPELPTVAEAGVPGYEAASWYGLLAPAGTPQAIVTRLNTEVVRIVALPDVRNRMALEGADPIGGTAGQFAAHIKAERARMAKVIKESGAQFE